VLSPLPEADYKNQKQLNMNILKGRSRSALDRTTSEEKQREGSSKFRGKPPIFLRVRSSTWWIALCVGFGGTYPHSSHLRRFAADKRSNNLVFNYFAQFSSTSLLIQ